MPRVPTNANSVGAIHKFNELSTHRIIEALIIDIKAILARNLGWGGDQCSRLALLRVKKYELVVLDFIPRVPTPCSPNDFDEETHEL